MIVCGPPANGKRASKAIARMQFTIIGDGRQVAASGCAGNSVASGG